MEFIEIAVGLRLDSRRSNRKRPPLPVSIVVIARHVVDWLIPATPLAAALAFSWDCD
jgi:hypothetical protein